MVPSHALDRVRPPEDPLQVVMDAWPTLPDSIRGAIAAIVRAIGDPPTKARLRTRAIKLLYLELARDPNYATQESVIREIMKRMDVARSTVAKHLAGIRAADASFPRFSVRKRRM